MRPHYEEIKLKPEDFSNYLLNEVGFKEAEELGTPKGSSKGWD
jgi:hypothetical protein